MRPYFQAHTIHVLTDHPLRQVLPKPETSGRLVKWAIELGKFDIHYKARTSNKGQAAADFISEMTPSSETMLVSVEDSTLTSNITPMDLAWNLYVDGSSNKKYSGADIIISSPDESIYEYPLRFDFPASNNVAEYEALIAGLQLARELGEEHLKVYSDSQLVVRHVTGEFQIKVPQLFPYAGYAKLLL